MNDDTRDNATDRPVFLNNESTRDAAVFDGAAPTPTAGTGAASTIYLMTMGGDV